MRRFLGVLGAVMLVGCGAGAGEAASAEPAADGELADEAGSANDAAEPGAAPGLKSDEAKPQPTADDASIILQLVIDDPELDRYLKLGEPGRFPLKIAGSTLPAELKLVKATEPVKIVDGPKSDKDPVLVINAIELEEKSATVRYRYPIEGIRGTARLSKSPHGWELKSSRIVEH
jgi:hypothetical protein